nr:MAG TPA: hypothetical protein [Microviridae sp.]
MSDEKLLLMVNLSKLVAVSEYLRERGDERISAILDEVIEILQDVLSDLKQK